MEELRYEIFSRLGEMRKFWVSDDIGWFEASHAWAALKSICIVEAVRKMVKSE